MQQNEDVFEFETEALALKNNTDYTKLLQCLNILSGFREQALNDLDEVLKIQDEALSDPLEFERKIRNGVNLGIPERLIIPEVPQIEWEKYKVHPFDDMRPTTRPRQREPKEDAVREKVKEKPKTSTFNKPWSAEEQMRLEQLLIEHPSEDNEARRFKKIAKALGNRTLSQVTSRCQKYFIKLHRAGLPVPGRIPRRCREINSRKTHFSTFFPKALPAMKLLENDSPGTTPVSTTFVKTEIDLEENDNTENTQSDRKLKLLRRVRSDLMRQTDHTLSHNGFMCNICKDDPLIGTRWHCIVCPDMDVCSWCLIEQLETDTFQHPLDHQLVSYRQIDSRSNIADKDYPNHSDNYLDMNYQPL